ncbi:MAG: hypothetical protein AAGA56_22580 [Myxococcota bacterium]
MVEDRATPPPGGLFGRRTWVVSFLLPVLIAVEGMRRLRFHTVDDAFISFRYARNLSLGRGLVYNPGERVEGYTNFLWTLVLGAGHRLGLEPIRFAKALGGLSMVALLGLLYRWSQHVNERSYLPPLAPWLAASSTALLGHAVFGLETLAFTALVVAAAFALEREETSPRRTVPWSGLLFAAAGLMRPEAPLFFVLASLTSIRGSPLSARVDASLAHEGAPPARASSVQAATAAAIAGVAFAWLRAGGLDNRVASALAALVVVLLASIGLAYAPARLFGRLHGQRTALFVGGLSAHFLFRYLYYGRWWPNSLHAKTGDMEQQLALGIDYLSRSLAHEGPVLGLFLLAFGACIFRPQRGLSFTVGAPLVGVVYVVAVGGDWMPLARFLVPFLALAYLGADFALRPMLDAPAWRTRRRLASAFLAVVVLVLSVARGRQFARDPQQLARHHDRVWRATAGYVASWFLRRETAHGPQMRGAVALGDIGEIGYVTDYPIWDLLGLVTPAVSQLPGGYTRKTGPRFRDLFFEARPRYAVLLSSHPNCRRPRVPTSTVLFRDRRFERRYHLAGRRTVGGSSWCVFERRDAPGARPLERRSASPTSPRSPATK